MDWGGQSGMSKFMEHKAYDSCLLCIDGISMLLDLCLFIFLFTIPTALVLSMCIGVGSWGWPSSWSIRRMSRASGY